MSQNPIKHNGTVTLLQTIKQKKKKKCYSTNCTHTNIQEEKINK